MPRVHAVAKAQSSKHPRKCFKCSAPIQVGDPYFYWGIMVGSRGVKKFGCKDHRPTPRDLNRSAFQQALYAVEDAVTAALDLHATDQDNSNLADAMVDCGSTVGELREETESSYENVPESLKEGHILQDRISGCEELERAFEDAASNINGLDDMVDEATWESWATENMCEREPQDCDVCRGAGTMEPAEDDDPHEEPDDCDRCKGEGKLPESDEDFQSRVQQRIQERNEEIYEEARGYVEAVDTSIS